MKKLSAILILAVLSCSAVAQSTSDVQTAAEAALRSGLPQAAIAPLKEALRSSKGDKVALSRLLARLQLAAGHPKDALETLDATGDRRNTEWKLLRAAALAAQGGNDAAVSLLEPLAAFDTGAALLLARIHAEQGDHAQARQILKQAPPETVRNPQAARLMLDLALMEEDADTAETILRNIQSDAVLPASEIKTAEGRLLLLRKKPTEAMTAFAAALAAADISPQVRDNARLGLARAATLTGDQKKAREVLRDALSSGVTPPALRQTMEDWIASEKSLGADPTGDLRSWSAKKDNPRGVEAALQLARLDLNAKGTEAALSSLQELLTRTDLGSDEKRRGELLAAEAKIAAGQYAEALSILGTLDGGHEYSISMLRGRALAASGSNQSAYEAFTTALQNAKTAPEKYAAALDRYLSALAMADLTRARSALETLREAEPNHPRLLEWSFLLAAAEARHGEIDGLSILARRTPATDYAFQAKLALAEWRMARGEDDAAERTLKTAKPEADTPTHAAALAAAEIFTADNAGSTSRDELIAEAKQFLAQYPEAPETTDIAFKLAELYSRGGDHSAAESVLAALAEKLPDGDAAALAKFLAAQAASRSMSAAASGRALAWFNDLAQGRSNLRYRARLEQASLLLRQRKFADALALQDAILASDPPPEMRNATRMERGDTLFALGAEDPAKFDEAASAYELVASDKTAPPDWRDQAASKRASALARRGQTEKALAIYQEILDRPPSQGSDPFWFLKAGLEAARLLEEQKDWPAAVAIYDRLATAEGVPRAELEQRARRLRLEHFIWEN